jgi:hypothetical protein
MIIIKMIGGEKHELEMSLKEFFNELQDEDEYILGFYRVFRDVFIRVENISSIYEIDD